MRLDEGDMVTKRSVWLRYVRPYVSKSAWHAVPGFESAEGYGAASLRSPHCGYRVEEDDVIEDVALTPAELGEVCSSCLAHALSVVGWQPQVRSCQRCHGPHDLVECDGTTYPAAHQWLGSVGYERCDVCGVEKT